MFIYFNRGFCIINSGNKIFYLRGLYYLMLYFLKRKNLIFYKINLLVFINDLRKYLDNMEKF